MKYLIGSILKNMRKNKKLSISDVKHFLHEHDISISEKTIYGWESNSSYPSVDKFLLLCELYEIKDISIFINNES